MSMIEALNWRYAVKQFSEEKIPPSVLEELLQATRLTASSYGLQPYRLVVVENELIRKKLVAHSYGQDKVYKSSHLLVFAVRTDVGDAMVDSFIDHHAKVTGQSINALKNYSDHIKSAIVHKSPEQRLQWAHQQAYIALGNLLTCAAMLRVDTCPIGGFQPLGFDRELGLEEHNLTSSVICARGYRDNKDAQATKAKVRLDINDLVLRV